MTVFWRLHLENIITKRVPPMIILKSTTVDICCKNKLSALN